MEEQIIFTAQLDSYLVERELVSLRKLLSALPRCSLPAKLNMGLARVSILTLIASMDPTSSRELLASLASLRISNGTSRSYATL